MPFLNLFKKTPQGPSINARLWLNQTAKTKACIRMAKEDSTLVFIAWSTATQEINQKLFREQGMSTEVILARDVIPSRMQGKNYVLLERHYDRDKEIEFLESLKAGEVLAHLALSVPL